MNCNHNSVIRLLVAIWIGRLQAPLAQQVLAHSLNEVVLCWILETRRIGWSGLGVLITSYLIIAVVAVFVLHCTCLVASA